MLPSLIAFKSFLNAVSPIKSALISSFALFKYLSNSASCWWDLYKISSIFRYNFYKYEQWIQEMGIGNIIFSHGGNLFIIILSIGIITAKGKFYLKKYLPFIPVLSNTLGIMLLITGKELRFVYSSILCGIPLLIYALSNISNKVEVKAHKSIVGDNSRYIANVFSKGSLKPASEKIKSIKDFDVYEFQITEEGGRDIGILGLGWINFNGNKQSFRVYVPKGVYVYTTRSKIKNAF